MFRLCLLGPEVSGCVLGVVLLDALPQAEGLGYPGCGVAYDLELSQAVGVVAGVFSWSVHRRVMSMAVAAFVRAMQLPHWPSRLSVPTLGLDFGYGHWGQLVQVNIFADFGVM